MGSFSGADFDSINDALLARLQAQFAADFNDASVSSLMVVLLDLEAYGLDGLSFFMDRRATEAWLSTARTRTAVARITRQLGYKMRSAVAASVDVSCTIPDTFAFSIPIPKGYLLQGPNDLVFEVARDVTFLAGETGGIATKILPCFEGQTFSESFVSDGSANQTFELRRAGTKYVVRGTAVLSVDGTTWSESEMLSKGDTPQYEVGYNDEPPTLRFGDGIAGAAPATGAAITITYLATSGAAGRVAKDSITAPVTPLVVAFQTITLTLNNPAGSTAGDDPEALEEAKDKAPQTWKARQVAVTQPDYEALGSSFADPLAGRVAVAQAFCVRSADNDLTLQSALDLIRSTTQLPVAPVGSAVSQIRTALDTIRTELANLDTLLTGLGATNTGLDANLSTLITTARQIEAAASGLGATSSSIAGASAAAKAMLGTFALALVDQIRQTTLDSLNSQMDTITAGAAVVTTAAGQVGSGVSSELSTLGTARTALRGAGLDTVTAGTSLYAAEQARSTIETQVGVLTPTPTGIYANVEVVDTWIVDGATNMYNGIDAACVAVFDHVDQILAADCKSNLVQVPILARDAGGFYAAPSSSLIQALQSYLDGRKEVTQVVEVVSGEESLVPAVISIRLGVKTGFSLSLLQTAALAAVDGILRGRKFGQSLYIAPDFDRIGQIEGAAFVNVRLLGYYDTDGVTVLADLLDASGNLIVPRSRVVTKGLVTVSTEYQTTS